ncbi:FAD-binding and (Fe-S)-binding domain-containing protein [Actinomadura violacea]|uniref:FAD-binding protein n=1 Tax=Actinomadura violacea TaxID=2819934 RepID=A0ABS3RVA7_9ACTN|nr:FAD-binding and (Fe-S)-binding domain-containing protein [Actinomadura violacea]MBO2459969.1 FAD-binding protein [Actinomadura violacea]
MTAVAGRRHRPVEFVDRGGLARDLGEVVEGEVRFDPGSTALYANDASVYRQVPVGVVIPRHAGDVAAALDVCRRYQVPVFGRGCGTGLAGQSVNAAVVFDFSKYMHRIVELDPEGRTARVQPGVICDQLREAAARHGLTFPVDPATHDRCTLGGMIGNNSCGTHSVMGGKTVDNVLELDVITYDGTRMTVGAGDVRPEGRQGEIYAALRGIAERYGPLIRARYPDIPRRVSGYNLDSLLPENGFDVAKALVGTESTCVLVLEARVRLLPDPPHHALLVIGYPDAAAAAEHVPELLDTAGLIGLECFDAGVIDNLEAHGAHIPGIDDLPEGGAWLLAEYGAESQDEANELCESVKARPHGGHPKVFEDPAGQEEIWEVRRSTIEFTRLPGRHSGLAGWEDAAVAPEKLAGYIRDYCALVERHGYHTVLFGHFGQGCMHNRLDLDLQTPDGVENFRRFLDEAGDLVVRYGGSLSGEHGDGQLRANQLAKMFGPELVEAFTEFKEVFDPDHRMNPGKVVSAYRPDQNLRLGTDYRPRQVKTYFGYPQDAHGFADAANRCFGIGKCRHLGGGTMCPSFMVTREEKHSTRGRARLLFEMMSGSLRGKGWRDPHVKEALDLCLSCKGCKGDCPVSVDMATYKAEFLAHYYKRRLRPRQAYALGLIPVWARLGSKAPGLVNGLLGFPPTGLPLKLAAGVDRRRKAPRLAARTFEDWFAEHRGPDGRPVMLWPDTFTNFFDPDVAIAAVEVLEDAGYQVRLPEGRLCCGRPLYDYGMLPTARRWLRRSVDALAGPVSDGIPLVGLEPSCLAVFRDELPNMFPDDADAGRIAGAAFTLAELLARDGYEPPRIDRDALVQVHCHQGAVLTHDSERDLMERAGLDLDVPDSGCCGMAGSFGYEAGDRYRVSKAAGERVLLPAVRDAPERTLIVADGFSCREQIAQGTGRTALHLAQVLRLAAADRPRP